MKETWNLRESVMNAISEATCCRIYEDPSEKEIGDRLCAEIEANFKCPHVVSSDEGSSYCQLAEASVTKMGNEIAKLKEKIEVTQKAYMELIMAVQTPHKGEIRHETALRYIRERENISKSFPMVQMKDESLGKED